MEAAFSSAARVTLAGSMMPSSNRSTYSPVSTLYPITPSPFSPSLLIVVLAPAITMRLIAEEKHSGTLEMLITLPVKDHEVILGKFLGAWGLVLVLLGWFLMELLHFSPGSVLVAGGIVLLLLSLHMMLSGSHEEPEFVKLHGHKIRWRWRSISWPCPISSTR